MNNEFKYVIFFIFIINMKIYEFKDHKGMKSMETLEWKIISASRLLV